VKLLQRLEKKDFENDSFVSHFFFMKSSEATVQNIDFRFLFFFSRYKVLWSKHHSSLSRGELFFVCKCVFLIF